MNLQDRPYLEVEVVKVKKVKKEWTPDCCPCCGKKSDNVVSGENLDKIKFPCFCSYKEQDGEQTYGELNKTYNEEKEITTYLLSDITCQVGYKDDFKHSIQYEDDLLERLLRNRKVHILKGKIIIFEEE